VNEYEYLIKQIKDEKDMLASALVQGGPRDYAEYKHLCGEIRGLSVAQAIIEDLVRKKKEREDD
jgi:hypothetical protein